MNTRDNPSISTENGQISFVERYINIIGLVVLLIGIVLWVWGYNLKDAHGNHSSLGKIIELIGEFLSLVVALHFLYELFTKKAERKILKEELNEIVGPQKDLLQSLHQRVIDLDEHTKTVFNLVRYRNAGFFKIRWKYIAENYNNLYIIGDFPFHFLELIKESLSDNTKRLSVYVCAEDKNFTEISRVLTFAEDFADRINLFHLDRLDWGFLAFGVNEEETKAEMLLNYFSSSEKNMSGYHIMNETAINLLRSLAPNIEGLNELSRENKSWPLKISDQDLLRALIDKRLEYHHELNNLRKGSQLNGEKEICGKMSSILQKTSKTLRVTHIAKGENISLLEHSEFQIWLKENYQAAKRGVLIDRIFLLQRVDVNNPIIIKVVKELKENNIKIRYIILEEIEKMLVEDFSIYDEKQLVYIYTSGKGPWVKSEDEAEARYSMDKELIAKYGAIFNALTIRAKDFK